MTEEKSARPEEVERFLADRAEGDSSPVSLEDLPPRHLLAVVTTSQGYLEELGGELKWETLLDALDSLPEDERAQWLLDVIRRLGTRSGAGIEAETGIRALGDRAYELRHQHPHVFICYLYELHRLLRSEKSTEAVTAAEEQFRRLATESNRPSGERVQEFHEQDIRDRLVDPNLGTESRVSLLETLADESLEDVDPDLVIDVLYPLRNHYDPDVEQAALRLINEWATELPSRSAPEDVIETLEASLADEQDELPPEHFTELLFSGHIAPAVINWLTRLPNVDDRQEVVEAAFEALQPISGIRGYSDDLCTFLRDRPLEEDAMHAGIDLLGTILVGLVPYQHTEEPSQDDHIRRIFFTDEELEADRTVRQTLRDIAEDERYPQEIRAHAVQTWLSVRPPEIHEALWDIDPDSIGDDPLVDAKLEAAAEHRLIEFVDVAERLWEEGSDDPDRLEPLVETLSGLETREIVQVLLSPAFDHDDDSLRDEAQEALIESGYEAEITRERRRRTLLERIESRYEAMATLTDTEREIRGRRRSRLATEADRKRARVVASEATSRSVDVLTRFRARGTALVLQLAPVFDRLERLAQQIDQLREQQQNLHNQIQEERDNAERLANEIESVENDIDATKKELENAKQERDQLDKKIPQLQKEISNLESEVNQLEAEMRTTETQEPSRPITDDEQRQREYQKKHRQWEKKMSRLQSEYESVRAELQNTKQELQQSKNRRRKLESKIQNLRSKLEKLRDQHSKLSRQLDESNQRISQYASDLEQLEAQLEQLTNDYESCQQRINQLTGQISQLRREAEGDRSQLTQQHRSAVSDASDARARLESLTEEQSAARENRRQQNERIRQLQQRLDEGHEAFEEAGQRTRVESIEADERAHEASRQNANSQYVENVGRWRLDSILRRSIEAGDIDGAAADLTEQGGDNG